MPGPRLSPAQGFILALGGGGARGWAHIGVARGLERLGLRPSRIVPSRPMSWSFPGWDG